jgi:hypothetical protein
MRSRLTLGRSYELPQETYRSHVYPRQSSNGSTVVICGHETGLRIIWYGGRKFKTGKDAPASKVNGTSKSDAMVVDLDDDEPHAPSAKPEPAEYEEEEEEVDPNAPYSDVIRCIDVPLGTTATRIAIPHIVKDLAQAPPGAWPAIYNTRLVVAASCSDLTLRIISAPLDPPSPQIHDLSQMDVKVVEIGGANSHQQFISDIAITQTGAPAEDQEASRPQIRSQSQPSKEHAQADPIQWYLLVASISCTGAGLLLVHQVPLRNDQISSNPETPVPVRRVYLHSSTLAAKLSFNTSQYPAERHSALLITVPSDSSTKVYQVFQHTRHIERRGSNATTDSVSTTRSARSFGSDRGKFCITLLPPSIQDDLQSSARRKKVLDAKWVAGGRAVVALLDDGEWGIWDLEAVAPTSSSSGANLIRGQGSISGIHGGSLTRFAVRSNITPPIAVDKAATSSSQTQPNSGSLVPMTPSTRKIRSDGLFQGSKAPAVAMSRTAANEGFISVSDRESDRPAHDEEVIISYGRESIYLPSVLAFWKAEAKPTRLPEVRLGGQTLRSISLLPTPLTENTSSPRGIFAAAEVRPDFLVQSSHRLIFSLKPLTPQIGHSEESTRSPQPPSDQTLLIGGNLDIDGMDRMLEDMGGASSKKPMNLFTKSVGFRIDGDDDNDDDGDVDMQASPTLSRTGLNVKNTRGVFGEAPLPPERRIFT